MTRCMLGGIGATRSFLVVETQKEPSMRFADSIFAGLLKPIDRRAFQKIVDQHDGDAYDKSFKSWDHLVALVYAQLAGIDGLRALEAGFNANPQHHYHLGTGELARSTLSDANARRPAEVFAQTFAMLSATADRQTRHEGSAMVELIDASPVPLGKVCKWAKWNGRIRGMKLHVVYDPLADVPHCVEITPANVNDVEIGRQTPIKAGTTYVFDKGYCRFDWWRKINDSGALFVTRAKVNMRLRAARHRTMRKRKGDGFKVVADDEVVLASKATRVCRSRCGASRSSARTADRSPSSPMILPARPWRSPPSTRAAGKSNSCSAGSSSISTFANSSAPTTTPSVC